MMHHDEGELHINQLLGIDYVHTRRYPLWLYKGLELFIALMYPG